MCYVNTVTNDLHYDGREIDVWKFRKEILNNKYWDKTLERVESSPIYEGSHRGSDANQVGFLGDLSLIWF